MVDYVAMTNEQRIFDNSLEKGKVWKRALARGGCRADHRWLHSRAVQPYDIRVVTGDEDSPSSTIKGLNEGLKTSA